MKLSSRSLVWCAGSALSLVCLNPAFAIVAPEKAQPRSSVLSEQPANAGHLTLGKNGRPLHRSAMKVSQEGYPNFDIRLTDGDQGFATQHVRTAITQAMTPELSAAIEQAKAQVLAAVPSASIDFDQYTGTVSSIRSTEQFLTGTEPNPLHRPTPFDACYRYINAYPALFQISADEVWQARIIRNYQTKHNKVHHVTLQQRFNGADISGARIVANVMDDGRLINFGSTFLPRPEGDFTVPAIIISDAEAIRLAAANVGIELSADPIPAPLGQEDLAADEVAGTRRSTWQHLPELRADEPVITKLVYFPRTRTDVRPAWSVVVPALGIGHTYDILVDASDGTILERTNRLVNDTTQPATYRIFTSDSPQPGSPGRPAPDGGQFPFVGTSLVTVTPDEIRAFSPDGWIPDNQNQTVGNNVSAHLDLDADNIPDLPRLSGPGRVFNFNQYNSTAAPATYQSQTIVQAFYWSNRYHDLLYSLGFDEPAGNFQLSNGARGGVGNDQLQMDVQDGGGTNNANFNGTGVDGTSARVQMYIFTGSTPDRDGSLDGDILIHELTHGTSIRLHDGISNLLTRGMGEGWSDFYGICFFAEPTDDPSAVYPVGGYATYNFPNDTFNNNFYYGIRRFPYTVDRGRSPLTLADTDPGQIGFDCSIPINLTFGTCASPGTANQVHNAGEIWCNSLIAARAQLWNERGFEANSIMMQRVTDGMKMYSPSQPNFLQARDSVIASDLVDGNVNRISLWRGFAHRGLGYLATAPASTTSTGIVENFDAPIQAVFSYPSGLPTQLQPGVAFSFPVNIGEFNLTLIPETGQFHYSINNGPFTVIPMLQTAPGQYTATIPALSCFDQIKFYTSVDTSDGRKLDPAGAPVTANGAMVFTGIDFALNDTGETDEGWTTSVVGATGGPWQRGVPRGNNRGDPASDFDGVGTGACWLTDNNPNSVDSDVDNGSVILTSRVFTVSNGDTISYAGWHGTIAGSQAQSGNGLFCEYATNAAGTNWLPLRGQPTPSPTWVQQSAIVGVDLPASATMRIRFIAQDPPPGAVVECAVDAIKVQRLVCTPPSGCIADFNQDGGIDGQDIEAFFIAWEISEPSADANQDGGVDGQDIEVFFLAWEQGEC